MPREIEHPPEHEPLSGAALSLVIAGLAGIAGALVLTTAPFASILGKQGAAVLPAAAHGMMAFLFIIVGTIGIYLAFRLFTGRIRAFHDLQILSTASATMAAITIFLGNWIYIYYRSSDPESPRSWLMAHAPDVHKVFFEFKEFAALFTLPLSVAAAFILWKYGPRVMREASLRIPVSILFFLVFFYLVVAFGLGAAVARIRPL